MYKISNTKSFFQKMPVPGYVSFSSVGLDISSKAIRLIKLKKNKKRMIPVGYKEVVFKQKCKILETDEDLENCNELRNELIKLKEEFDLKYVNVSLPETRTFVFKTKIPMEALETIEDALLVKIQENVPIEPSNILYDYLIPGKIKKTDSEVPVVITAFPKEIIATYTTLLKEIGLIPVSFDSESQSIARAVIKEGDVNSYLLINMGYSEINLAIVENRTVEYTSSIQYEGELFKQTLDGPEAQSLKRKINQLLVYWFTNKRDMLNKNEEEKITKAIVTGSLAADPVIINFLEHSLHISVKKGNIWENCFDLNNYIPPLDLEESLKFSTALGLSLVQN